MAQRAAIQKATAESTDIAQLVWKYFQQEICDALTEAQEEIISTVSPPTEHGSEK